MWARRWPPWAWATVRRLPLSARRWPVPEDGPSVGSSDPPQASSSNGRISARAMTPRKRRGVLISIRSPCLLGRGMTARRVRILSRTYQGPKSGYSRPRRERPVRRISYRSPPAGGLGLYGSAPGWRRRSLNARRTRGLGLLCGPRRTYLGDWSGVPGRHGETWRRPKSCEMMG